MRLTSDLCGRHPIEGRAGPARRTPARIDFERLVGADGWARLPAAVRARFAHRPLPGQAVRYRGVMHEVACSRAGFGLAQLCRLVGTPLAPWPGRDVPTDIVLRDARAGSGIVWERVYRYQGHAPVLVRSLKRLAADGALLECVGGGLGMRLAVFEQDGALHFRSVQYFWRLAGWHVPLPDLLTPGVAHVVHRDLGDDRFRFDMTFEHRLLGVVFRQSGIFRHQGDLP
jgi:hypothetical protein